MTDRELLELAAKAAGYKIKPSAFQPHVMVIRTHEHEWTAWRPIEDDGDALRLAVKLRIEIVPLEDGGIDAIKWENGMETVHVCESNIDQFVATRRAIVRAAAEIGKQMESQKK